MDFCSKLVTLMVRTATWQGFWNPANIFHNKRLFFVTFPTVFRVDMLKREAIPSLHEKYGVENHDAN